jgi:5-methylcytosine-specific restriction endonuclease McrA
MRGYIKARRKYRRERLLGGECVRCGATDDLEFDHIDPKTKAFAVVKGKEDHPEPSHGYYRYWYYGCRCAECKADNAEKSRRQRERAAGARATQLSSAANESAVTASDSRRR